jgi:hypothetical protein
LYFLNAPLLFWGVWRVVCPFVHAPTRQKIHFIGGARGRQELLARIPAQVGASAQGGWLHVLAACVLPSSGVAASVSGAFPSSIAHTDTQHCTHKGAQPVVPCWPSAAAGAAV